MPRSLLVYDKQIRSPDKFQISRQVVDQVKFRSDFSISVFIPAQMIWFQCFGGVPNERRMPGFAVPDNERQFEEQVLGIQ